MTGLRRPRTRSDWDDAILDALRIPPSVLPTVVDSIGRGRRGGGPARAPRRSAASPATSRRRSSARAAPGRAWPRPPSAPAGMLDLCPGDRARALRPARRGGHLPDRRLAARRARRPGASRPSCSRPAPASSGCATTSASSPTPRSPPRGRRVRGHRRRVVRPRPARAWARRCGTSGPGARCSASPGARVGPSWCGPCSRASPTAAPTSLEAAEADSGLSHRHAAGRRRHVGQRRRSSQALADATGRPVEVSPVLEATTLGAAYLAGMALGTWARRGRRGRRRGAPAGTVEPGSTEAARAPRPVPGGWRHVSRSDAHRPRALGPRVLRPHGARTRRPSEPPNVHR